MDRLQDDTPAMEEPSHGTPPLQPKLSGVPETLLVPLWARCIETRRSDGIVRDPYALRILQHLDYDFAAFDVGWKSQLGIAIRTWLLDREVALYLDRYPAGTIVNLGCGLDARSLRLDNGVAFWFDLDLPEVIELRAQFLPTGQRHRTIASSVLDLAWLDAVDHRAPPLFIAEGLFMYLPEAKLRMLMQALAEHFPEGQMLVESLSVRRAGMTHRHDLISKLGAEFVWGIDSGRELEAWHPQIRFLSEWSYLRYQTHRWRWLRYVGWLPVAKKSIKISLLRFAPKSEPGDGVGG